VPPKVEGARRESAGLLKRQREQWVSSEKGKLSKLASEKGEGLKEEAVRALEVYCDFIPSFLSKASFLHSFPS